MIKYVDINDIVLDYTPPSKEQRLADSYEEGYWDAITDVRMKLLKIATTDYSLSCNGCIHEDFGYPGCYTCRRCFPDNYKSKMGYNGK